MSASRSRLGGATVHNIPSRPVAIAEVIDAITGAVPASAGSIGFDDVRLPFPEETDGGSFAEVDSGFTETPLEQGVGSTIERFQTLLRDGRILAPVP